MAFLLWVLLIVVVVGVPMALMSLLVGGLEATFDLCKRLWIRR